MIVCLLVALVVLAVPQSKSARETPGQPQCKNNLKYIGLALWSYHKDHGSFPPAFIADETGKPMHSWRVLLLPYVGHSRLYSEYRFDEPWDGPHNSQLQDQLEGRSILSRCPEVYRCPEDGKAGVGRTSYVAIVGPRTAWKGSHAAIPDLDFPKANAPRRWWSWRWPIQEFTGWSRVISNLRK